jgi:uncharacterized damage-inducible protein DinB
MHVPPSIASAARNYRFNSDFLIKIVQDLAPEDWLKAPALNLNHISWIVGHLLWSRSRLMAHLGVEWTRPWVNLFARSVPLGEEASYPPAAELLSSWHDASTTLAIALETVSEEALAQPAPAGPPSPDGKIGGLVNFLAIHETYHIGQASYLRAWLGKPGLMG